MIVGVGTDIVGLERIGRLIGGERGEAFARRVLSAAEQEYVISKKFPRHRYIEFMAGRWAAKEAVAKAFGCGICGELGFRDIELLPDDRGKPRCIVAREIGRGVRVHVSISHADGWASAFAVAELDSGRG